MSHPTPPPDDATQALPVVASWVVVSRSGTPENDDPTRPRRLVTMIALGSALVFLVAAVVGIAAARKLAERQAVNDAANKADLLAEAVVQPALRNDMTTAAARRKVAAALEPY